MLIEEISALFNSLKVLYALENTFIFIEIIILIMFHYIKNILHFLIYNIYSQHMDNQRITCTLR